MKLFKLAFGLKRKITARFAREKKIERAANAWAQFYFFDVNGQIAERLTNK